MWKLTVLLPCVNPKPWPTTKALWLGAANPPAGLVSVSEGLLSTKIDALAWSVGGNKKLPGVQIPTDWIWPGGNPPTALLGMVTWI